MNRVSNSAKKEQVQASPVRIRNYGTQVISSKEEESEKDFEAILFGTALHYTLEMLGTFDEKSLAAAMHALQNRYGQVLKTEQLAEIKKRVLMLISDTTVSRYVARCEYF